MTASVLTSKPSRFRGVKKLAAVFSVTDAGALAISSIGKAYGRIVAVEYDPGTIDTAAVITISDSVKSAVLTLTAPGTSPLRVRPTCIPAKADGTAVSPGAGYDGSKDVWVCGDVYLTVASGGAAGAGKVNVIVVENDGGGA